MPRTGQSAPDSLEHSRLERSAIVCFVAIPETYIDLIRPFPDLKPDWILAPIAECADETCDAEPPVIGQEEREQCGIVLDREEQGQGNLENRRRFRSECIDTLSLIEGDLRVEASDSSFLGVDVRCGRPPKITSPFLERPADPKGHREAARRPFRALSFSLSPRDGQRDCPSPAAPAVRCRGWVQLQKALQSVPRTTYRLARPWI